MCLTVLVEEHSDGNPAHVEPIQKILHVLAGDGVGTVGLFKLHHTLSHGGHHVIVSVPDLNHSLCEAEKNG